MVPLNMDTLQYHRAAVTVAQVTVGCNRAEQLQKLHLNCVFVNFLICEWDVHRWTGADCAQRHAHVSDRVLA